LAASFDAAFFMPGMFCCMIDILLAALRIANLFYLVGYYFLL
jgi:hypothetical protein